MQNQDQPQGIIFELLKAGAILQLDGEKLNISVLRDGSLKPSEVTRQIAASGHLPAIKRLLACESCSGEDYPQSCRHPVMKH